MPNATTKESVTISTPRGKNRIQYLGKILGIYSATLFNEKNYKAPEQQMLLISFIEILAELLGKAKVEAQNLGENLNKRFRSGFDPDAFNKACEVVSDYCSTGKSHFPSFEVDSADQFWMKRLTNVRK